MPRSRAFSPPRAMTSASRCKPSPCCRGCWQKIVEGERAQKLVARLDETLGAMSGMLNTLLDINQIEAGTVRAEMVDFPINDLLDRLKDEFTYHAQAQRLDLRVVPCSLSIYSDPRLLEQMIRNLLSNALKYTKHGKVLLGCRRRRDMLSIEVWDTGIGIPEEEFEAIFEEYHQLDNAGASNAASASASVCPSCNAWRFAGPSCPCPLAAGQGLGLFHRGHASAERYGPAA